MLRCYITDRRSAGGDILPFVERAVAVGVDYIQLREKDLRVRELLALAREVVSIAEGSSTKVLINSRADVAMVSRAQGVHLPGGSPPPRLFHPLLVSVSCHTVEEVRRAEIEGAAFALFSPVFDSPGKGEPVGLEALGEACRAVTIPVLALGGVTYDNAEACLGAGAAGIAGIRLFQVP